MKKDKKLKQKSKFEDEYILASGYPWAFGEAPYTLMGMCTDQKGVQFTHLAWPDELWAFNVPEYRLVLRLKDCKDIADAPCGICWTYSWAPCPEPIKDIPCKPLGDNDWQFCQMCLAEKKLKEYQENEKKK